LATLVSGLLILALVTTQILQGWDRLPFYQSRRRARWYVRWPAYVGLILSIAMLGKTGSEFIYFQF
jgi:hypothetical protein